MRVVIALLIAALCCTSAYAQAGSKCKRDGDCGEVGVCVDNICYLDCAPFVTCAGSFCGTIAQYQANQNKPHVCELPDPDWIPLGCKGNFCPQVAECKLVAGECAFDQGACYEGFCRNGGICVTVPNTEESDSTTPAPLEVPTCICPAGFSGDRCTKSNSPIKWVEMPGTPCEYFAVRQPILGWDDAHVACQTAGGELTSILSEDEDQFIATIAPDGRNNKPRWIGLRRAEGEFEAWSDGEALAYTNWGNGEPRDGNGRCVFQDTESREVLWRVGDCDEKRRFICKRCNEDTTTTTRRRRRRRRRTRTTTTTMEPTTTEFETTEWTTTTEPTTRRRRRRRTTTTTTRRRRRRRTTTTTEPTTTEWTTTTEPTTTEWTTTTEPTTRRRRRRRRRTTTTTEPTTTEYTTTTEPTTTEWTTTEWTTTTEPTTRRRRRRRTTTTTTTMRRRRRRRTTTTTEPTTTEWTTTEWTTTTEPTTTTTTRRRRRRRRTTTTTTTTRRRRRRRRRTTTTTTEPTTTTMW